MLILLSLWYLLYESVLKVFLQNILKNKLYALRDEIRLLILHNRKRADTAVLELMDRSVNSLIDQQASYTLSMVIRIQQEIRSNQFLREQLEQREQEVRRSGIKEIPVLYHKAAILSGVSLLVNSGGWAPFLLPFIFFRIFSHQLKQKFIRFSGQLTLAS